MKKGNKGKFNANAVSEAVSKNQKDGRDEEKYKGFREDTIIYHSLLGLFHQQSQKRNLSRINPSFIFDR